MVTFGNECEDGGPLAIDDEDQIAMVIEEETIEGVHGIENPREEEDKVSN